MSDAAVFVENCNEQFDLDREMAVISDAFKDLNLSPSTYSLPNNSSSENVAEDNEVGQLLPDIIADPKGKEATGSLSPDDIKEPSEIGNDASFQDDCCKNQDLDLKSSDRNEWIYILGHDQLKKRVLKVGEEDGIRPEKGQRVEIRCIGRLDDGTKVDEFGKLEITLGEEEFLLAFDLCIPLMQTGEVCELVSESRFAYGQHGRRPDIPPNSKLTYEIELLNIKDQVPYSEMSTQERFELGDKKRLRGNFYYERGEYSKSLTEYMRALKVLEERNDAIEENFNKLLEMKAKCYNNMAAAQMHIEAWDAASSSCDEVLRLQPNNVKALYRKGKCMASMGEVRAALVYFREAARINPEKPLLREIMALEERTKREKESEKALYQKMLGFDKAKQKEETKKKSDRWKLYVAGAVVAAIISMSFISFRYSGGE